MPAELFNRVREGNQILSDIMTLQSRVSKPENKQVLSNVLYLYTVNDKVNEHNDLYLQSLDIEGCISLSVDYTIGDVNSRARQTVLAIAKDLPPQKT